MASRKGARYSRSERLFTAASRILPGGVNSPVRAFKSVGATPIFVERGRGAQIEDADGNKYIDYVMSWGPLIHGHAPRGLVRELARRDYARESARQSVDYVLMFLPNEQLTGFIHESDPALIDEAMNQRVVMCSPLTLFAFLGVIRQAYDNFVVEQTSDQILALIGKFGVQWVKYNEQLEKVHLKFSQLDRQFDELMGPRRRQLAKPLEQLDAVRRERNVPIDGQLFTELPNLGDGDEADDDLTPDNIRRLGA